MVRLALAAACVGALLLAPSAHANPPSYAVSLSCQSGVGPTTITGYSPKISVSAGAFNVGGPLFCEMERAVKNGTPWVVQGTGSFNASGSFAKVVNGTGTASGAIDVYVFGALFRLPFDAAFAGGEGPAVITNGWDTDGGRNGVGTALFNEPVCPLPGCGVAFVNTLAFSVALEDVF